MSTTLSTSEASSLLKPDPPIGSKHSLEETSIEKPGPKDCDESGVDKSGDLLNYEHEDEVDDDELETLRLVALQSRKAKKPEQPAYIFKQHPSRNNLTQIVLAGHPAASLQISPLNIASVALPDTSLPPPGYTPLSIPQVDVHGTTAYGVVPMPYMQPALTLPPPLHPDYMAPPLHLPPVVRHEPNYRPTDYYDPHDHSREKDVRYLSSHQVFRDRSPESRDSRERRRSPYGRDTYYREKYHTSGSSPGYMYRGSPAKDRGQLPLKRISSDNRNSTDAVEKGSKFSRYLSGSENDDSDESEEEVEEEVEVTASESEGENEADTTKTTRTEVEKGGANSKDTGLNKKDSEEIAGTVNQVAEADDVINFHCTEEVDEFSNFLNEFEDELKEKPLKAKDESIVTQSRLKQGENKENKNGDTAIGKKKRTKIVKRMVKRPKRKNKFHDNGSGNIPESSHLIKESSLAYTAKGILTSKEHTLSDGKRWSPKRRNSRSPNRDRGYSPRKYTSYSPDADLKRRRQRTPTLSPEPNDKRLRFDSRLSGRGQERNRSPYKKLDADEDSQSNESKSKSLPPSRVLGDNLRSNSRGALSQSREQDHVEKNSKARVKETPEEREERAFADKLKRAETQEDRNKLIARRQKFTNKIQPIEITKKVISLKSKADYVNYDEPLNEKRLRNKSKGTSDQIESKNSRLPSDSGDAITLGIEDTLDMFDEDNHEKSNTSIRTKGNVTDLRVQLYKKRLQSKQRESAPSERDAREKLSKGSTRLSKSSVNATVVRRTVNDRFIGGENEHIEEDDNLDPLEKATVDDISPRPIRQRPDELEESLSTESKSRLVLKDASIGLRGRKVEAFVSNDNSTSVIESLREYSDEDQEDISSRRLTSRKAGLRVSVLDRLGEPVHKQKMPVHDTEDYDVDYQQLNDSNEFDNDEKEMVGKETSQSQQHDNSDDVEMKKSKREKREKKDKKEKRKLKELKKLEKKLKKLKAKKHQKKSDRYDSEASETEEEDYDDRIEYFMSDGDQEEQEASTIINEKESKKLKRTKSSPKRTINKRHVSGGSNHSKKEDKKVDDSDDELFAFFEKDDSQLIAKSSLSTNKRSEPKGRVNSSSASNLSLMPLNNTSKKKKDTTRLKGGSSNGESNLLGKMKKKSEKTIKRMKEIEEDKLVHR